MFRFSERTVITVLRMAGLIKIKSNLSYFSPIHLKLGDSNEFNLPEYEIATLKREARRLNYEENPPKCKLCNFTFTAVSNTGEGGVNSLKKVLPS